MSIKSFILAITLFAISPLHAGGLYKFSNLPLSINQCNLEETNNALDLALMNDGYFVVSQDKKDSELLFTRYGMFMFNAEGYIITNRGDYLLGINKKSDPSKLSKFKVSTHNLPPKATSRVK